MASANLSPLRAFTVLAAVFSTPEHTKSIGRACSKFSSFRIFEIQLIFDPKVRDFRLENIYLVAQVIGKSSVFI